VIAGNANVDYLIDTSVLSRLLDATHPEHRKVKMWEASLPSVSRKLLSVVAIAELRFGLALAQAASRHVVLANLNQIISAADKHTPLEITRATAQEYAQLKAAVVAKFLPKRLQQRPNKGWGNPEDWIDEYTGRTLKIQENDLWQCAQAIERDLTFVSFDSGMDAIEVASGGKLKLLRLQFP
jgi:predicted nucleic acid-binding protein